MIRKYISFLLACCLCLFGCSAQANDLAKRFQAGGFASRNNVTIKGLPVEDFDKDLLGHAFNAAFYLTPWLSLWYQYHYLEDIDFLFDEGDGDLDVISHSVFISAENYFGDSNYFLRGKLGLSEWQAEGFTSENFEFGLGGLEEGRGWAFFGTFGADEETRFEGDDTSIVFGVELGYSIRRRVDLSLGVQFMNNDLIAQNSLLFSVSGRFP